MSKHNEIKQRPYILQGPSIIRIKEEDIPNTFFTSDLHLNHKNVFKFTERENSFTDIDNMTIKLTNNLCIPSSFNNNILFHCGDMIFGSKANTESIYKELASSLSTTYNKVYAVIGNHDYENIMKCTNLVSSFSHDISDGELIHNWYWNTVYIVEVYREQQCILKFTVSHFPMNEFYGSFNIHGHLHSTPSDNRETITKWRNTGKHFDCGCDNNEYMPVSLKDIVENKTSIKFSEIPTYKNIKFNY